MFAPNIIPFPWPRYHRVAGPLNVWVADDKRHIRSFLSALLRDLGCTVHEATAAFETNGHAIAGKVRLPPAPDAMDVALIGVPQDVARAVALLQRLAATDYAGKILLMGGRHSLALHVAEHFAAGIGLSLLPVLGTPFRTADLERRIAIARLPDPPQSHAAQSGGRPPAHLIRLTVPSAPGRLPPGR